MRVLALLLALAPALGGCMMHLERNAPGRIDPRKPPQRPACREVEVPEDPGEHQLTLSSGVLFAGGGDFSRKPGEKGIYALSVETTLHWGRRPISHKEDPPLLPLMTDRFYPTSSLGLSLGAQVLEGGSFGNEFGTLYAEVQGFSMKALASGLGLGWAVDPRDGTSGPQVTLFGLGVFLLRFAYLIGEGAELTFGIQLKAPLSWTWSQ